jgi:hypothetical protein
MTTDSGTIARRYIDAVGDRDFETLESLFDERLVARTGGRTFDKAEWTEALRRLVLALDRNETRHVFSNGGEACIVYDFVTDTPAGAVPCVEILEVDHGRIAGIELIFEKANWPQVLEAIAARSAA